MKNNTPTEHEEQRAFVMWFRQTFKKTIIFAIPNGGMRSKRTAGMLKAEGVQPGVPDLFVPEWLLWIEMKRIKGGSLSPSQKEFIEYLVRECGHTVIVGMGEKDAADKVMEFSRESSIV